MVSARVNEPNPPNCLFSPCIVPITSPHPPKKWRQHYRSVDNFKRYFVKEKWSVSIILSFKSVPWCVIDVLSSLVLITAWHRTANFSATHIPYERQMSYNTLSLCYISAELAISIKCVHDSTFRTLQNILQKRNLPQRWNQQTEFQ